MKILRIIRYILAAATIAILLARPAFAAEARPWLCRDKPVFSSDRAMEYQVTARPGRQWRIFFMQSRPAGRLADSISVTRRVTARGGIQWRGSLRRADISRSLF